MPVLTSGETRTWTSWARATVETRTTASSRRKSMAARLVWFYEGSKCYEAHHRGGRQPSSDACEGGVRDGKRCLCRVLRDVIPPTPPGPERSDGNGSLRAQ